MIEYIQPIFRPPSEGRSFLLQATVGCSHNSCTYCAMYRKDEQKFRIRPMDEIKAIIDEASGQGLITDRVFIADGNALVLSQAKLIEIMEYLNAKCAGLTRIRMYANVGDILRKGAENLKKLKKLGLDMVYIGFESGDDVVLERIKKGASHEQTVQASKMLKEAGIMNSAMVLLGMGGKERSEIHALETGRLLTACDPEYVGALSLQLRPGAPLYKEWDEGRFELPDKFQMIRELKIIVENTELSGGHFFANHISNYLPIKARFPRDKQRVLDEIDKVLQSEDETLLRPDFYRDVINQY
ncbi:MAG: radical SAM protein [Candidatus Dadabacteria bacterium]|nr:radical SAM protein [Candidatus Dadabacteria bacterium]NIS09174.1 radical SAM protein [Candidatus Dadabacteria bacterium]NIY22481.1 radical SAM protein [Candidatus Dadabacteria bacterium]